MEKVLVTGAAGFIGYHTSAKLLSSGYQVIGLDNLLPYYDIKLKTGRLQKLGIIPESIQDGELVSSVLDPNFRFIKMDVADRMEFPAFFAEEKFDRVIHLAAQPGVRESIRNPYQYIDSNINGWITVLEACRNYPVKHLVFASSSSVYGNNKTVPFGESDRVDNPVSLYAATKKSGELMAYSYSHLYQIKVSGLRFFTVYGPWGRPDMAYFKFVKDISEGKTIEVFNQGDLYRDFTYIDDIVDGIKGVLENPPTQESPPFEVLNIGHSEPVQLLKFIETIEQLLDKKAFIKYLPMQAGDVYTTYANVDKLEKQVGFKPKTSISEGLEKFIRWYQSFYHLRKTE